MLRARPWRIFGCALVVALVACSPVGEERSTEPPAASGQAESRIVPEPQYSLSDENTHNKFSSTIPPTLQVPSGSVIEVFTKEATGGQLGPDSTLEEAAALAAWFSDARDESQAEVQWTRRKYVRKPRGAPPGTVIPQRVKTVFVEPDPSLAERLARDVDQ